MAGIRNAGHLPDAAATIKPKPALIRDPPKIPATDHAAIGRAAGAARGKHTDIRHRQAGQLKMLRELMSRIVTKTIKVSTSAIPVRKAHSWPFADIGFRRTASAA